MGGGSLLRFPFSPVPVPNRGRDTVDGGETPGARGEPRNDPATCVDPILRHGPDRVLYHWQLALVEHREDAAVLQCSHDAGVRVPDRDGAGALRVVANTDRHRGRDTGRLLDFANVRAGARTRAGGVQARRHFQRLVLRPHGGAAGQAVERPVWARISRDYVEPWRYRDAGSIRRPHLAAAVGESAQTEMAAMAGRRLPGGGLAMEPAPADCQKPVDQHVCAMVRRVELPAAGLVLVDH